MLKAERTQSKEEEDCKKLLIEFSEYKLTKQNENFIFFAKYLRTNKQHRQNILYYPRTQYNYYNMTLFT